MRASSSCASITGSGEPQVQLRAGRNNPMRCNLAQQIGEVGRRRREAKREDRCGASAAPTKDRHVLQLVHTSRSRAAVRHRWAGGALSGGTAGRQGAGRPVGDHPRAAARRPRHLPNLLIRSAHRQKQRLHGPPPPEADARASGRRRHPHYGAAPVRGGPIAASGGGGPENAPTENNDPTGCRRRRF